MNASREGSTTGNRRVPKNTPIYEVLAVDVFTAKLVEYF